MLFAFIYEIILWFLAFIALPKMLYQCIKHKKYRNSFALRCGYHFPKIVKGDRKLVWIHAVSVGETKAVAGLAKIIKKELTNCLVIVSNTTETGHAEAQRSISEADYHVYLPLDFSWAINPIVKEVKPDLVILCESDFWFNFLKASKGCEAKVAVVNGKLSARSTQRFQVMRSFAQRLFSYVDIFCVQSSQYQTRFRDIGIDPHKILVTGNMKFDENYSELTVNEKIIYKQLLGIRENDQVLVLGSTHDPEENLLLDVLEIVWKQIPNLKVLLVPRHPERFDEVTHLLQKKRVSFLRYSSIALKTGHEKVILIDAMGILQICYQLADIALVGGSYTERVGGHNIIEPCRYGIPLIFGPYMHGQPELVALVKEYQAGLQVPLTELAEVLIVYLNSPSKRQALGQAGKRLMNETCGATAKTWEALKGL